MKRVNGKWVEVKVDPTKLPRTRERVDAVLWLGPTSSEAETDPAVCGDAAYQALLRRKATIMSAVFGMDFGPELKEVETFCARAR